MAYNQNAESLIETALHESSHAQNNLPKNIEENIAENYASNASNLINFYHNQGEYSGSSLSSLVSWGYANSSLSNQYNASNDYVNNFYANSTADVNPTSIAINNSTAFALKNSDVETALINGVGAGVGAVVGAGGAVTTAYLEGERDPRKLAAAGIVGGSIGAVSGALLQPENVVMGIKVGAIVGVGGGAIEGYFTTTLLNPSATNDQILNNTIKGALSGGISGAVGGGFSGVLGHSAGLAGESIAGMNAFTSALFANAIAQQILPPQTKSEISSTVSNYQYSITNPPSPIVPIPSSFHFNNSSLQQGLPKNNPVPQITPPKN